MYIPKRDIHLKRWLERMCESAEKKHINGCLVNETNGIRGCWECRYAHISRIW